MPSALLALLSFRSYKCVVFVNVFVLARLTQATAVSRHGHEGAQASTDDAVRPAQGRLLEGAGVLVQKGVHAVGGGGPTVPHKRLCKRKTCASIKIIAKIRWN